MNDRISIDFAALPVLSTEERRRSLKRALAEAPAGEPLRVFAYGSLIWNPCFAFEEAATATLDGFRRAFNFWTVQTRGTPEAPGLGLGLEPGGSCRGVLYRISEADRAQALETIWEREMPSAVYSARWLPVRSCSEIRQALCFVTDPTHAQYAGSLDPEFAAPIIAQACGTRGRCRDYLADAVRALAQHGIPDRVLEELLERVDRLGSGPVPAG